MVRLIGKQSNRDAIGSRVRLTSGGTTQTRNVISSSGYLSQSDFRLHFGLGKTKKAEKIEIRWPDGKVQVLKDIDAKQVLTITQHASGGQGDSFRENRPPGPPVKAFD
jgi:hypothetical protein